MLFGGAPSAPPRFGTAAGDAAAGCGVAGREAGEAFDFERGAGSLPRPPRFGTAAGDAAAKCGVAGGEADEAFDFERGAGSLPRPPCFGTAAGDAAAGCGVAGGEAGEAFDFERGAGSLPRPPRFGTAAGDAAAGCGVAGGEADEAFDFEGGAGSLPRPAAGWAWRSQLHLDCFYLRCDGCPGTFQTNGFARLAVSVRLLLGVRGLAGTFHPPIPAANSSRLGHAPLHALCFDAATLEPKWLPIGV